MTKSVITAWCLAGPASFCVMLKDGSLENKGGRKYGMGSHILVCRAYPGFYPVLFHEMVRLWAIVEVCQNLSTPESYPFGSHLSMEVALASEPAAAVRWRGMYH